MKNVLIEMNGSGEVTWICWADPQCKKGFRQEILPYTEAVEFLTQRGWTVDIRSIAAFEVRPPGNLGTPGTSDRIIKYSEAHSLGFGPDGEYLVTLPGTLLPQSLYKDLYWAEWHRPETIRTEHLKKWEMSGAKSAWLPFATVLEETTPPTLKYMNRFVEYGVPEVELDFVSETGSKYWLTAKGVVRQSDHWGKCKESWMIIPGDWNSREIRCGLLVESRGMKDIPYWDVRTVTPRKGNLEQLVVAAGGKLMVVNGKKVPVQYWNGTYLIITTAVNKRSADWEFSGEGLDVDMIEDMYFEEELRS